MATDEKTYIFKQPSEQLIGILDIKPSYNMTFNRDGKQIGVLDFNGPEMVFTGDADESAKVFFDFIAKAFRARLEQERADERNSWPAEMEAMERQVNILTDALAQAKADERNRTWTQEHWTEYEHGIRNATLDEIATKIYQMPFGDTAASFAVWIREQKA